MVFKVDCCAGVGYVGVLGGLCALFVVWCGGCVLNLCVGFTFGGWY